MSKCFPIKSSQYTLQCVAQMSRHLLDSWEQKNSARGVRNNEIIANRFRATPMKSDQNFPKKMHHMLEKELYSSHVLCTAAGMLMFLKEQESYLLWGVRACVIQPHLCHHVTSQWGHLRITLLSLSSPHLPTFYYVFSKTYSSKNFKIAGEA